MGKTGTRKLVCGGYKLYGKRECTNHFVDYELLYKVVLQEIRGLLTFTEGEKEELEKALLEPFGHKEMTCEERAAVSFKKTGKRS
uniref:hypothetical protein n=1 Tax=Clostridium sp. NkU-1 TaxID=1095009 RepID=UPI000ACE60D5